jgi:hypothetical protein
LIVRLKVGVVERRIEGVRAELETKNPDSESQAYSDTFAELIALERTRRELRSQM